MKTGAKKPLAFALVASCGAVIFVGAISLLEKLVSGWSK